MKVVMKNNENNVASMSRRNENKYRREILKEMKWRQQ
jgi:hypothetical protein